MKKKDAAKEASEALCNLNTFDVIKTMVDGNMRGPECGVFVSEIISICDEAISQERARYDHAMARVK